jgi:transcriptional regulator with XRE-family HTH domain
MKDLLKIHDILKIDKLENSYDFEKAALLDKKLRLMIKEHPSLSAARRKIRTLMTEFEESVWSDTEYISDALVQESDQAEKIIEQERLFIKQRKNTILKKLKSHDMTQQDLGVLLGHSKSYMSELMNGVSQFSLKDIVIIHRLFGISLNKLVVTSLQTETREKINKTIMKLNKPKLKIRKNQLISE